MSEENLENKQDDIQESDILDQFEKDLNGGNQEEKPKAPEQPKQPEEPKKPEGESNDEPVKKTGLFDKRKKEPAKEPEKQPDQPKEPENNTPSDDDAPEHITDKVGWKAMKQKHASEIASKDEEIAQLKQQIGQSSLNSPEYQQMKSEHEQMAKRLAEVDIQNSPDFVKKYSAPAEQARQRMAAILKEAGLDGDHNLQTIFMQGEREQKNAIADISDELGKFDGREFEDCYRKILSLNYEAADVLANAENAQQQLRSESTFNMEKAVQDTFAQMTDNGHAFLSEIEPDNPDDDADVQSARDYNNALNSILNNATQKSLSSMDEQSLASVYIKAELADLMINHGMKRLEHEFDTLLASNDDLQAKLDKIQRNNPQVNGSKGTDRDLGGEKKEPQTEAEVLENFEKDLKAQWG